MLILALQFWEGDKRIAMDLARLLADLEPTPRTDVYFLFSARFDATHDIETIQYVSKKFPVLVHTTSRKGIDWPNGPNQMMADTYEFCVEYTRKRQINANAVFLMESDCVPLAKDWLNQIIEEYRTCDRMVLGAWLKRGDAGVEHVNGNCIISLDFWKRFREILNPKENGGWDATLAYCMLPNAHPSRLIWSDYHLGTPKNPWRGCDYLWTPRRYNDRENALYGQDINPVWYHGPKNGLGLDCVRKRLLK